MARSGRILPCLVLVCVAAFVFGRGFQMSFVHARVMLKQTAPARTARPAAGGADFDVKSILEPVDEEDPEVLGRSSAFFFAHIGYLLIPVLKGLTLAVVFAAAGYFSANGKLTSTVGKGSEETAKSVEDVSKAVGRQSAKLWNAVVGSISSSTSA
mmetsp:Transcript_91634/g.258733  ORF Transcript_91634/g.258733 Transcript_91634/m.258733 type:complete len:155 (-) Transcript_91634:244-708(-)